MKKALLILADGFEEIEALGTVDILRRLGVEVVTASVSGESVTGAHNIQLKADSILEKVVTDHFDAVILPGGMPGATNLDSAEFTDKIIKGLVDAGCEPYQTPYRGWQDYYLGTEYRFFNLGRGEYQLQLRRRSYEHWLPCVVAHRYAQ